MRQKLIWVSLACLIWPAHAALAQDFLGPIPPQLPDGTQRAFPTAEGYGAVSTGGRGGAVCIVTNLSDTGSGSLRDCLENETGARTVVFEVGGIIDLSSNIIVRDGNVTVAGQSAPGDGVCLRGGAIIFKASDGILRYMCTRRGDQQDGSSRNVGDNFGFNHATRTIVDHFSFSWSIDEQLQSWFSDTAENTVQYSLFTEPIDGILDSSEGRHGYGPLLADGGSRFTLYKNVMLHQRRRSPWINNFAEADVINNIIYNWGGVGTHISNSSPSEGTTAEINLIGNVYRAGYNSSGSHLQVWDLPSKSVYISGNESHLGKNMDFAEDRGGNAFDWRMESAFPVSNIASIATAAEVWSTLADEVGARVPALDPIDTLALKQLQEGTGAFVDCVDKENQDFSLLIEPCETESAYGSYYDYPEAHHGADYDTDRDGIADAWEITYGLDPNNPNDRNGDMVGDGWTNLEYYLNQLAGDYSVTSETSEETTNDTSGNEVPLINVIAPLEGESVSGNEVPIQIEATDPDSQPQSLAVSWRLDDGTSQEAVFNEASGYYEAIWDSTTTSDGNHLITAIAMDGSDTTSDTTFVSVENTTETSTGEEPTNAHIADLDVSSSVTSGNGPKGKWTIAVSISVHDKAHADLPDATVSGDWSGGVAGNGSCKTGSNGRCSVYMSAGGSVDTMTFTVLSVDHANIGYAEADNHDPDGDSDGTSITANRHSGTSDKLTGLEKTGAPSKR